MSINNSNPNDLNRFRLTPGEMGVVKRRTSQGRRASPIRGKFISGPVDVAWVCQAAQLGVTALLVGLALWHIKGLRHSNNFIVSNLMLKEWGVQPDAKTRALRKLEKAGLIIVERQVKHSPRVTLIVSKASRDDGPHCL